MTRAKTKTSPRIKCPIILSAFRVGGNTRARRSRFDFSLINLFDEFRQPSVPYYRHTVDSSRFQTVLEELDENIDEVNKDRLRQFGRLFWNLLIPKEVRDYLRALDEEYALELLLMTNDIRIPWEIVHDDVGFWALRYSIGRIYGMARSAVRFARRGRRRITPQPPLLLIADPAQNLDGARKEGEVLKRKLRDTFSVTSLAGEQGTYDLALAIGSNEYDIIHFAGHAQMTKTGSLITADGKLGSDEIAQYSLARNPIVFANACSTAAGGYYGAYSRNIAEAFIEAGAAAFIGTLWKTNDEQSTDFASVMYEYLKSGYTIGDSLLRARKELFERSEPNDINWAAFSLFGNPDSRLYCHIPRGNVALQRIQVTMSNERGTLGKILVALSQLKVNIVQGRSITLDDEKTAGYIAEVEIPIGVDEDELRGELARSLAEGVVRDVRFIQ